MKLPHSVSTLIHKLPAITQIRAPAAFTMLELLVTLTIISLVTVVVIPGLRSFNQGQELDTAKSALFTALRVAQSKANAGIVCPNVDPATISLNISWLVTLHTNGFSQSYTCIDQSSTNNPRTITGSTDQTYPTSSNVTMNTNSCNPNVQNTTIRFISRTCPAASSTCQTLQITCGNGSAFTFQPNQPFIISLNDNQSNVKTISISEGGTISEN